MIYEGPASYRGPDGRWVHRIRQSDIQTFRHCPELLRLALHGLKKDRTNDSAAVGTAMHKGCEVACRELLEGREPIYDLCLVAAVSLWHELYHSDDYVRVQVRDLHEGGLMVEDCLRRWWRDILPLLMKQEVTAVEIMFDELLYEDEWRSIRMCGQCDVWTVSELFDWKSANKKYSGRDAWKYQRGYLTVQHVQYSAARLLKEGVPPKDLLKADIAKELYPFSYVVVPREPDNQTGETDILRIVPTAGDVQFLLREYLALATLIEAGLPQWPLGPSDWWCSNKWCENWDDCRGRFHKEDPWDLMAKQEAKLEKPKRKRKSA